VRADRLLSILLLLQSKGLLTAAQLAATLGVSERTIYRDLDALNTAGVPVYTERGPNGGCALVEGYRTSLTGLTEAEVRTLFVASVSRPLADLGLGQAVDDAMLKLLAALPSVRRDEAQRVRQRILLDAAGWFRPEEPVPFLPLLQRAVWEDRKIDLVYRRSDGQQVERRVDAYGLVAKASIWYLVGVEEDRVRVYRVSRVQDATVLDEQFERPQDFDLATYWASWSAQFEASRARYPVRLRLAPALLPVLPQIFGEGIHTTIAEAGPPDGGGWVTLSLTFETPDAARSTILGFGALAEVLDPPELRESVIDTARRIVAFYED